MIPHFFSVLSRPQFTKFQPVSNTLAPYCDISNLQSFPLCNTLLHIKRLHLPLHCKFLFFEISALKTSTLTICKWLKSPLFLKRTDFFRTILRKKSPFAFLKKKLPFNSLLFSSYPSFQTELLPFVCIPCILWHPIPPQAYNFFEQDSWPFYLIPTSQGPVSSPRFISASLSGGHVFNHLLKTFFRRSPFLYPINKWNV